MADLCTQEGMGLAIDSQVTPANTDGVEPGGMYFLKELYTSNLK